MVDPAYIRKRLRVALRRLPVIEAPAARPVIDQYNQPSGDSTPLGTLFGWYFPAVPGGQNGGRPTVRIDVPGVLIQQSKDDELLVVWREGLPDIQAGDQLTIKGRARRVKAVSPVMDVLTHYYLE